jgi:spore maturation protein CgeB
MKVLEFFNKDNGGYLDDPLYYFNFKRFENQTDDFYLFLGDVYNPLLSNEFKDKPRVVLSLEEPNFCTVGHHIDTFNTADLILSLCPYTSETLDNRQFVFFPYPEDLIPSTFEKEFDIIYSGHYHGNLIPKFIETISKFNYRFVNYNNSHLVTNVGCSYNEKLKLYSKSKIALIHNLLFPSLSDVPRYKQFTNANQNKAFDLLDYGLMPQIKSRLLEAAFNKSLILCFKDHWKIIEKLFEPDKEFIYFENNEDLKEKINYILNNYDNFKPVVENAFNKAINNYTTQHFFEKFLKPITF